MESFPNTSTSGLSFNSNGTELNYEELRDLHFVGDLLSLNIPQQKQPENTNVKTGTGTLSPVTNILESSTNFTSQTSCDLSQSTVSLSNNMLPTPEGFDSNEQEQMIVSPYNMNMITDSEVFQDELFFDLDSSSLAEPSNTSFMQSYVSAGHLSPQTSPSLSPDPRTRHQNQKEKSSFNQNRFNLRYSPIIKRKIPLNSNNNSTTQFGEKSSFNNSINNSNHDNINKTNEQNDTTTNLHNIIATSPTGNSMTTHSLFEFTSSLNNIVSTSIATSLQDTMPNLSLEGTMQPLLTSILSNGSSSSFSDNINPITPSSLMKIKIKQPNSLISEQNDNNQSSKIQPILIAQSQQRTVVNGTGSEVDLGLSHVIISPNVSTNTTSRMASITTSPIISTSPSGKSIRPNPNISSPLALGPSIHSKSPQTLKPIISPNLKPKLSGVPADEIAKQLANKSNYQNILEGRTQSLGILYSSDVHSSLESRRTTHKAAEQKRRDLLKQSFDELKKVVPVSNESINQNINDDDNGKSSDKNVSKLSILKRARDHIVELQQGTKEKDELIQKLIIEVDELKRIKKQKTKESDEENSSDIGDTNL